MNKLKMAHDFVMNCIKNPTVTLKSSDIQNIVNNSWQYADLMQAEADKREDKTRPAVLQDEWQPDWSVAPADAVAWKAIGKSEAYWLKKHTNPAQPLIWLANAPTFNYQGNWADSLRNRPEGE